ncbi:hypothetical protein FisN_5Lu279 [Fistulifera solaris]|uniref:Uncharacterized protein n=1 Tax=Fistulifera solaris TaxID=1519565 RepID=A0A1Z5JIK3_FISSO|nr:hypothetical protein FisN_5Lu279 [Fistulifera solaris]|eukprot:GAX13837.1 hypothetical protein FisN_5Lu279 [Fistulifera solaris]
MKLDESTLKHAIYGAMPEWWQKSFDKSSFDLARISKGEVLEYFIKQQNIAKKNPQQNSSKKQNNDRSNNKWKGKNNDINQGNNQGNKNNGGSNKRKTFKAVGDCRKRECLDKNGVSHHDWNNCWYNRNGNNYNPNKIRKINETKNSKTAPQDHAKNHTRNSFKTSRNDGA